MILLCALRCGATGPICFIGASQAAAKETEIEVAETEQDDYVSGFRVSCVYGFSLSLSESGFHSLHRNSSESGALPRTLSRTALSFASRVTRKAGKRPPVPATGDGGIAKAPSEGLGSRSIAEMPRRGHLGS